MKAYIGVKRITATPMDLLDYNTYRGWKIPPEENNIEGYLVEYDKGGKPNHVAHKNYISWSPKDVFEGSYHPEEDMLESNREMLELFL